MSIDDRRNRGEQARRLLDDDLFKETVATLERKYIETWRNGKTVEIREDAHRYLKTLDAIVGHFRSIATTGKLATQQIAELEGRTGLRRVFG